MKSRAIFKTVPYLISIPVEHLVGMGVHQLVVAVITLILHTITPVIHLVASLINTESKCEGVICVGEIKLLRTLKLLLVLKHL